MNYKRMWLSSILFNRTFLLLVLLLSVVSVSRAGVCDSIGVERKDGKLFILHRIEANETLYSLSRKYKVSVDEIKKYNPDAAQGIKLGQILKVPSAIPVTNASTTVEPLKTHTVQAGESLYGIAKKHNVSVDEIKAANPGISSSVQVGQVLTIPAKGGAKAGTQTPNIAVAPKETIEHKVVSGETFYSIAKKYNLSVEDIKNVNPGITALKEGQILKVPGTAPVVEQTQTQVQTPANTSTTTITTTTTAVTPKPANTSVEADTIQLQQDKVRLETMQTPKTTTKAIPATDGKKVTESGFADVMSDNQDNPKYLAYHKTAPIGTIIQLLNESNGIKIYVRVVGKLTDAGADGKTIIRISKKAYERLGGTSGRLSTTLMYIP
jgi:LysM repeat protein